MYNKEMWKKIRKKFFSNNTERIDCLVVGLGNPGEKYEKTAHNAGFRIVSRLKENLSFSSFEKDNPLNSLLTKGVIEDKKVALLLPLTYMNLSGEAVRKALKRFNIPPEKLILVHDDTDLPVGTIRFSIARGDAGHKGVSSVIKSIKTKNFTRLRVGFCKKQGQENEKAKEVVLKGAPPEIEKIEEKAAEELKEAVLFGPSTKTIEVEN